MSRIGRAAASRDRACGHFSPPFRPIRGSCVAPAADLRQAGRPLIAPGRPGPRAIFPRPSAGLAAGVESRNSWRSCFSNFTRVKRCTTSSSGVTVMPPLPQAIAFQDRKRIAAGDLPAVAARGEAAHGGGAGRSGPRLRRLHRPGDRPRPARQPRRGRGTRCRPGPELGPGDAQPQDARPGEGAAPDAPRGAGRPRLGVVAREVTLLPRHWEWLRRQPGGASATLRRLVDAARRAEATPARHARRAKPPTAS